MNKRLIILALAVSLYQLISLPLYAVKAYSHPFSTTQPDGIQLTIRIQGDEFQHYKISEDGYLLKANAKGFLTYASTNTQGEIVESEFIARNVANRSVAETQFLKTVNPAAQLEKIRNAPMKVNTLRAKSQPSKLFPVTGSPHSLVILVNFKDVSFVTSAPEVAFSNLLNQEGYSANAGTGSARDYFMASSYGKFAPDFDVYGPVTLPNTMEFYGANDENGTDVNAVQMVVDACTLANAAGLDLSKYDADNDGVIDNVFIYYAGYNAAEQGPDNSIWPHRGGVYPSDLYSNYNYSGTAASVTFNAKRLAGYACTSELRGSTGANMCGVGTFCHEFGHVLGLPDYYNVTYSASPSLNSWDIMDAGNYNNNGRTPPTYSVFDRFFLGYLTPEQVSTGSSLTLLPIYQGTTQPENTANQAFLFSATTHNLSGTDPNPNEYFMVEYRKQTGWDTYLPAEGLCIWHVDHNQDAWNDNTVNSYTGATQTAPSHMGLYLQPLSGSTTTPGTAFTAGSFTPMSWSNIDINRAIKNITKTVENIKFDFMPPKMTASANFSSFSTNFGTPSASQSINISALNLTSNLNIVFQNSTNFEVKLSTDNTWSKSLGLVPVSGSVNGTVDVRYNPKSTGTQTDLINISSNALTPSNLSLSATAAIGPDSPVIFAGTVDNSLLFYPTRLYTTNTKTINIKTFDIVSDLGLAITGTNASLFAVSVSSIAKDAANGITGNDITINYMPTTLGMHNAVLTISGGGLPDRVVSLSGSGY